MHNNGGRRSLKALITAIALSFAWVGGAAAAIEPFALPGALPPRDGGSSAAVPIGFPINFFGVTHTQIFVNNDGNVTLGAPGTFSPVPLAGTRQAIIAPFFADVDTRPAGSGIVRFGTPPGRPDLFVVDWIAVGYFNQHADRLNSFQLILKNLSGVLPGAVPGDFGIEFNYDRILWETGDGNLGANGLGGRSARVGFSNGSGQPGTFFELPGSGSNGSFLDGGTHSLVGNRLPTAESVPLGRYQFVVRNGAIAQADLAVAANIDDDGFEFVVRNFGPLAATGVKVAFGAGGGRITAVRPSGPSTRVGNSIRFPVIQARRSKRIRFKTTSSRVSAVVTSLTGDSDQSNNSVRASRSCRGQILSQSMPVSVLYEPTATVPARQTLRLKIINFGDKRIQIRRLTPVVGQPFLIDRVKPRLPHPIKSGGLQVFRVQTQRPVAADLRVYPAQRPYFRIRLRCLD